MTARTRPPEFNAVAGRIEAALAAHGGPSAAVAVAREGEILWEEGFGWADRDARIAATPHSVYSLASISKPVTATALMMLAERGAVDLDEPANRYLGGAALQARVGEAHAATLRRLANHTAGLPLHYHYFYADEAPRPPSMDETIRRYGTLVTAPGRRYQYANLGYGILGYIVERVSGTPFADFLRAEIFGPLAMERSSVWLPPSLERNAVRQYGADGVPYPHKLSDHSGAGAIHAGVHDVVRFGSFHLGRPVSGSRSILADCTVERMQAPTADAGDGSAYGVGWSVREDVPGYRTVGHEGSSGGVATRLLMFPRERVVIVVLTNSSRPDPYLPHEAAHDIAGAVLPDYGARRAARAAETGEVAPSALSPAAGRWSGHVDTYDGQYRLALNVDGESAVLQLDEQTARVESAALQSGYLSGSAALTLPTSDAMQRPHGVSLDLMLQDDQLSGAVIALTPLVNEGGAPGRRLGFALGHWAELKRVR